ncbi:MULTISPECIES: DMT family transporter [Rhodopseudomonas]|uniref:Multidrug DMT transporter permease n=1 Tax=Rhodopseudomonas palustris TaxID=1076 RepID=A0A0D7EQD9_RHOPL|nr:MULTISPECIES: DMT family transporter [Rhodopseudomonas]KIZ42876.1 multidrug DMT transporter permease [Rhodopseudomonas palustris]MDF3813027.1 DMT family transporter [Rhodopseudomonas sp. BAL398]WOK20207.1 DMT family transporter [Rhodopseudomonas sp. BAL398]
MPPSPSLNRRPHDRWIGLALLAVTAFGWGLNWPAIKILLADWPPLFSRGVSGVAAAIILALIARGRGESLAVPRGFGARLSFAAFTNVFAWMGFGTMAMKYLSVSEGSLLVYTMPIWATLFAWPVLGQRPAWRDGVGLLLGICGIAVLFGGQSLALGPDRLIGVGLALAAATLFALGGVLTRTALPMPPTVLVAWQVGLGCLPMIGLGLMFERPDIGALSAGGAAVLLYMTLVPMGLCYLSWFAALGRLPTTTASIAILVVPIIGVVAAALALGEPLGWRQVAALVLTLAGVALALQRPKPASTV